MNDLINSIRERQQAALKILNDNLNGYMVGQRLSMATSNIKKATAELGEIGRLFDSLELELRVSKEPTDDGVKQVLDSLKPKTIKARTPKSTNKRKTKAKS